MLGMQERANIIGATLDVASGQDGTKVTLVAPMHATEGKEGA